MPVVPLICHPSTPCAYAQELTVHIDSRGDGQLAFQYRVTGSLDTLEVPPQRPAAHVDGLWKQTCFEAFARIPGARGYFELNFSPSGEWAAYAFDDYRAGMRVVAPPGAPQIVCRRGAAALDVDVGVQLPVPSQIATLELAISAVLRDQHGETCYWALAHPPGKPDFHHRDSYALMLALNGTAR